VRLPQPRREAGDGEDSHGSERQQLTQPLQEEQRRVEEPTPAQAAGVGGGSRGAVGQPGPGAGLVGDEETVRVERHRFEGHEAHEQVDVLAGDALGREPHLAAVLLAVAHAVRQPAHLLLPHLEARTVGERDPDDAALVRLGRVALAGGRRERHLLAPVDAVVHHPVEVDPAAVGQPVVWSCRDEPTGRHDHE